MARNDASVQMTVRKEDEAKVREILRDLGVIPLRSKTRSDPKLTSLVLPPMDYEQRVAFEEKMPIRLFAFQGRLLG